MFSLAYELACAHTFSDRVNLCFWTTVVWGQRVLPMPEHRKGAGRIVAAFREESGHAFARPPCSLHADINAGG